MSAWHAVLGEVPHNQGDGLAQAMRQVPPRYFTEDFTLSRYGRYLMNAVNECAWWHLLGITTN